MPGLVIAARKSALAPSSALMRASACFQAGGVAEVSSWVAPPRGGLLTLVCGCPEIGLPEVLTDLVLPDLAVGAAGARSRWEVAGTSEGRYPLRGVTRAST